MNIKDSVKKINSIIPLPVFAVIFVSVLFYVTYKFTGNAELSFAEAVVVYSVFHVIFMYYFA
jgi:hypothetical protein